MVGPPDHQKEPSISSKVCCCAGETHSLVGSGQGIVSWVQGQHLVEEKLTYSLKVQYKHTARSLLLWSHPFGAVGIREDWDTTFIFDLTYQCTLKRIGQRPQNY